MNYYAFHIGDYASATAHLTPLEDIAYRRLLDRYYMGERALTSDISDLCRLTRMHSECERNAVAIILKEFFILEDGKYVSRRAEKEIAAYSQKSSKAKASAESRWNKEKADANALRTQSEGNAPNTITNTNNQKEKKPRSRATSIPDGFSVSERVQAWASEKGHSSLTEHLEHFVGTARAKDYRYVDWDDAFMNAIRKNWAGIGQSRPAANRFPTAEERADEAVRQAKARLAALGE